MKAWGHLRTILRHKKLVRRGCFRLGLYRQGIMHDWSKYSPTEFLVGCKYYQGNMSPNNVERKEKGYSSAWLHHKGRNKHHLEYWIDYSVANKTEPGRKEHGELSGMKMPIRYVVEMFVDRICASKNYNKESYTDAHPLHYYEKGKDLYVIHEDTRALLELLLVMLAVKGEEETFSFVRREVLKGKLPYEQEHLNQIRNSLDGKAR